MGVGRQEKASSAPKETVTLRDFSTAGGWSSSSTSSPVVQLNRLCDPSEVAGVPEKVRLGFGGRFPTVVHVGRSPSNDVVLDMFKCVSKLHCQLALRPFTMPAKAEFVRASQGKPAAQPAASHAALFLRDTSRSQTRVNGSPAFTPWHWLQHEDTIGIMLEGQRVLPLFQVDYMVHQKLPGRIVTEQELKGKAEAEPANDEDAEVATEDDDYNPRSKSSKTRARAQASNKRGSTPAKPAFRPSPVASHGDPQMFGDEIVGRIVDVTYENELAAKNCEKATYRMRIMDFDKTRKWHIIDSKGLSEWDGESFEDTINLNDMWTKNLISFVDNLKVAKDTPIPSDEEALIKVPPKRARTKRSG